jgi:hypothetical protein
MACRDCLPEEGVCRAGSSALPQKNNANAWSSDMKIKNRLPSLRLAPRAAGFVLATALPLAISTASAFELDLGDGASGSLDTTVSYGAAWRTEDPNRALAARYPTYLESVNDNRRTFINKNDGDGNFDNSGKPVSSVFKITSDLELKYGDYGAFVRGTAFYDSVIMDGTPNRASPNYYPNSASCNVQNTPLSQLSKCGFPSEIDDHSGSRARFLDAYAYGNFTVADHALNVRLGEQVLSWGEALFLQDGINSANPVSLSNLRLPGAEVKEALLPLPMLYASLELSDKLTAEAFYEFDWDYSEPDDVGTFYSSDDAFAGEGANRILVNPLQPDPLDPTSIVRQIGTLQAFNNAPFDPLTQSQAWLTNKRVSDKSVNTNNQYGIAFRYSMEATELGLFFMNYNSHKPVAQAITGDALAINPLTGLPNGNQPAAVRAYNACLTLGGTSISCAGMANAYNYIDTTKYQLLYPEDIHMIGASFSTTVGDLSLSGELAYRPNDVILSELGDNLVAYNTINATTIGNGGTASAGSVLNNGQPLAAGQTVQDWVRLETYHLDLVGINNFGPQLGADVMTGVLELGAEFIPNGENKRYASTASLLNLEAPYNALVPPEGPSSDYMSNFSWGYRVVLTSTYNDAIAGWALSPVIRFAHDVQGNSNRTGNFLQNRKAATVGVNALYNQALEVGVAYNAFWGADKSNLLTDRDNITASVKYSF